MHNYLQSLPPLASSKYRTIKNRLDGQPPRSFISLYVFHRSRLLFSLTACFQADLSHLSFLSFHLTSQKSGCRRCQLHLRPSKRLLCLPAEENHRPDRISLAQNRHNYLGAALLHLIRGNRDKCFFSPRRTRMLSMGLPALSASVTALRPAMTSLSLSFSMNKPIPFRGFRTRLRPKFAILSQYIVDYSILIFAIATETRNLARFLQAVFTPKTAVFLGSFFAALFSSF